MRRREMGTQRPWRPRFHLSHCIERLTGTVAALGEHGRESRARGESHTAHGLRVGRPKLFGVASKLAHGAAHGTSSRCMTSNRGQASSIVSEDPVSERGPEQRSLSKQFSGKL